MDLFSLISGIRPLLPSDHDRKIAGLRAGFAMLGETAPSFLDFVTELPPDLTGASLGNDAEDFYLTSLLAPAAFENHALDIIAAAILHHITLQLNFMTRFMMDPAGPECVVLDGDPALLPVVMANGNVVCGIQVSAEPIRYPAWTHDNASVKLTSENLTNAPRETVGEALKHLNRSRVGCLYIDLPVNEDIDIVQRYATLGPHVGDDTFFVISGNASRVMEAALQIEDSYPQATVLVRFYDVARDGLSERRGILVASGIPNLPSLILCRPAERLYKISTKVQSDDVRMIDYRNGGQGEQHEWVKIKRPVAIRSGSPLPEEARRRISDDQLFPHVAAVLRGGTLVPWRTFNCNTFVYVTQNGDLISDVGEENAYFAPEIRDKVNDEANCALPIDRVINVKGAAMPLTFTPGLHGFFSHFLLQCFPRVKILRDMKIDAKIIIDHNTRPKQLEMLRRVGIGPDQIVLRPEGVSVRADEMIVPRLWPLVFSPYTLDIYEELAGTVAPRTMPTGRRILISREARSTWRSMLTYPAVAQMLKERYGFEEVRPEHLSLDEEIHLYRDARMVIGAEGAGLYSAVYAQPGATYVSVGDEDYIMPVLGSAASVRGFDVAYVFGESLRADSDVRRRLPTGHADYMVDPATVAKMIEQLL